MDLSATVFTCGASEETFLDCDDVARIHAGVEVDALRGLGRVVLPDDENFLPGGPLLESAGDRNRFAHRQAWHVREAAGVRNLAIDEKIAVLVDGNGHLGIQQIAALQTISNQ